MRARKQSKVALTIALSLVAGSIAVLNFGGPLPSTEAATACRGGDGGGGPSPTSTESPSPSESDTGILPPPPTILPTEEETESPSESPSPTPSPQERRCASEITIDVRPAGPRNRARFSGRVRSEEADCRNGRPVVVKKQKRGRDRTVASTATNNRGRYRVLVRNARGRFYAIARRTQTQTDEGPTICRPDRSRAVRA